MKKLELLGFETTEIPIIQRIRCRRLFDVKHIYPQLNMQKVSHHSVLDPKRIPLLLDATYQLIYISLCSTSSSWRYSNYHVDPRQGLEQCLNPGTLQKPVRLSFNAR